MPDDAARLNVIEEAHADWHPDIADHVAWLLAQLAAREGDVEKLKAIADDVVSDWQREKHQADTLGAQLAAREAEVARLREKLSGCIKRHDSMAALRADLHTVAEALQEIEWIRDHDYEFCPACNETRAAGHAVENCTTNAALDAVRDALRAQGGDTA